MYPLHAPRIIHGLKVVGALVAHWAREQAATNMDNFPADSAPIASSDYDERANGFWSIYVKEAEQHDTNITDTWKSDMDSTLIFAGLFSATVTAFIIESYKFLHDDSEGAVKDLITQILAVQIVSASLNSSVISLPNNVPAASAFHPAAWAIAVNILWFLSLTCSLAAALCVTLVQQWTRVYLQRIQRTSQPQRRATIRGIMFSGAEKWRMSEVVEYIPILLHISLFLFFVGLCTFLLNVSVATAGPVLAIVVCCLAFYILATVAPLIDPTAPYETPFSSLLWHSIPRQVGPMIPAGPRSLSEVRERLASPPDRQSLHRRIHAVSWVYDRTTDDRELQELITNIPGLLSSQDGQIAWRDFLDQSSGAIPELEGRIITILKDCSTAGYLDKKTRHLRATLCADALLAISSSPDFLRISSTVTMELGDIIRGSWDDDGVLATKSICAQVVFCRRERLLEIQKMKSSVETGFRELSNEVDQALRDIDDMRQILEDVVRKSRSSGLHIQMYKTDIANLLRLYFAVVAAKTSILHRWMTDIRRILSQPWHFPLLSFYCSMPPVGLHIIYTCALAPAEESKLVLDAYQMLAYLRLQGVYPSIPETSGAPFLSTEGLSKTWFPVTEEISSGQARRTFRPFDPTERLTGSWTLTDVMMRPIDPDSPIYDGICRELQPISELLDILDTSPVTTVTVSFDNFTDYLFSYPRHFPQYQVPLTTLAGEQPRSIALILNAVIEDKGTIGGLSELMTTIKSYSTDIGIFNSSIISQLLDNVFSPLSRRCPMSTESQILFVGVLQQILDLERHTTPEHEARIPFCDADIGRLCDLLLTFNHELPVTMAERALGTTLDSIGVIAATSPHIRAFHVHLYVMADRKRSNVSRLRGELQPISP